MEWFISNMLFNRKQVDNDIWESFWYFHMCFPWDPDDADEIPGSKPRQLVVWDL